MQNFIEWTESAFDNPRTSVNYGFDPFASACQKLTLGLRQDGKLAYGYGGPQIIANLFGLNPAELNAAQQKGIIDNGDIDTRRLQLWQKTMNPGQSSNVNYSNSIPSPPPVPGT